MKTTFTIKSGKSIGFFLLFMLFKVSSSFGTAKGTLSLSNCTAGSNYIEYQINVTNTSDAGETIYMNSYTPRINHLVGIVPAGTNTFTFQYVAGSCDPAVANWYTTLGTTYNVQYTASSRLMQGTQTATIYGNSAAASNCPIAPGATINCGKFRLTITNTNFIAGANVGMVWTTTSGFTGYVNTGTQSVNFNTTTNRVLGIPCSLTIPAGCNLSASASVINASCFGASNGSITVSTTNGTGPYMLKQWTRGAKIVLEANPEYRGFTWDFVPVDPAWDDPLVASMKGKKMPQIGRVEITIIEEYLPAAASDDDIRGAIEAAIQETGASSMKDMGKVMKATLTRLAGKSADGSKVSQLVKEKLS